MRISFIIADTYRTEIAIIHENEHRPYGRRVVTIDLSPEQEKALELRKVGMRGMKAVKEEILDCFVSNEGSDPPSTEGCTCPEAEISRSCPVHRREAEKRMNRPFRKD